ncbi:hypothetical protein V0288_03520 [Pannus brasiliensis CCIBt3594]|uniref:Uncharacterized protein n=1 Tax=Pannus brasiliensis CCIBt3594 TaxID=1427578 RepID=A0AAW9QQ95_9CHRO
MSRTALLSSLLVFGALMANAEAPAIAQERQLVPVTDTTVRFNPIPGLFNRAFYNETGRFYDMATISGQLNTLFGWRTFPEGSYMDNMIDREGKLVETLYYEVMQAQQAGRLVRTADLENPFDTSLLENPSYLSPGSF